MSEFESKLKETNENNKGFFNFNGDETQLKHIKEVFLNDMNNSKNDPKHFIDLLNFYSKCRLNHQHVSIEIIECACSCFPEQINEIQQLIKKHRCSQIHHISRRISNK